MRTSLDSLKMSEKVLIGTIIAIGIGPIIGLLIATLFIWGDSLSLTDCLNLINEPHILDVRYENYTCAILERNGLWKEF